MKLSARIALSTALLVLSVTARSPALAQDTSVDSSDVNCALIREGVQRLACYDARHDPKAAREAAADSELEESEATAEAMVADREALLQEADKSEEDDPDRGVMKSLVNNYLAAERAVFSFAGGLVAHKPNYILPITWADHPNSTPFSPRTGVTGYDYHLENEEAKYQISFKVPLLTGMFEDDTTFWFGYTQKSFWQVYNQDESAPFRETNYEPELFFRHQLDWDIGPGTLSGITLGLNHQSNGQSDPRSRSWNRLKASAAYSYNRWLFMVEPWYRLPESRSDDDNPDIESYLGYANYRAVYKLSDDRTFSLNLLNNLRSDNRTSLEFGYSFPIGDTLKGFVHYYNGYGESLIDYNERIERIGLGIMLNDWL
ncbi:MAG TPA: phospholipase A [Marinobacter sp.]|nr:phospholipase A [Marinobacter sp.]